MFLWDVPYTAKYRHYFSGKSVGAASAKINEKSAVQAVLACTTLGYTAKRMLRLRRLALTILSLTL